MDEINQAPQITDGAMANQISSNSNCCQSFDEKTATTCVLCKVPICGNCFEMIEHNTVCKSCHAKVLVELENENATDKDIPMAIIGGIAGASLGAFLWVLVMVITGHYAGFAAIGVGFLAGHGVAIAVGKRKAFFLQIISAICAIVGCLMGFLATYAHMLVQSSFKNGNTISYFDSRLWLPAFELMYINLGFFNYLMIAIAIWFAWRISAPTEKPMHT